MSISAPGKRRSGRAVLGVGLVCAFFPSAGAASSVDYAFDLTVVSERVFVGWFDADGTGPGAAEWVAEWRDPQEFGLGDRFSFLGLDVGDSAVSTFAYSGLELFDWVIGGASFVADFAYPLPGPADRSEAQYRIGGVGFSAELDFGEGRAFYTDDTTGIYTAGAGQVFLTGYATVMEMSLFDDGESFEALPGPTGGVAAVPLPAAPVLLLSGVVGLLLVGRRRAIR